MSGFSAIDVVHKVGVTYRQLDYWARTGLCRPSISPGVGSGNQRRYSRGDVVKMATIKRLLDLGVSLQCIRRVLSTLGAHGSDPEGCRWLIVSGASAVLVAEGEAERALTQAAIVVDLKEIA